MASRSSRSTTIASAPLSARARRGGRFRQPLRCRKAVTEIDLGDKEAKGGQLGDLPVHASPANLLERAVQRVGDEREPTPVPSHFQQSLWMITQAQG